MTNTHSTSHDSATIKRVSEWSSHFKTCNLRVVVTVQTDIDVLNWLLVIKQVHVIRISILVGPVRLRNYHELSRRTASTERSRSHASLHAAPYEIWLCSDGSSTMTRNNFVNTNFYARVYWSVECGTVSIETCVLVLLKMFCFWTCVYNSNTRWYECESAAVTLSLLGYLF